MLDKQHVLGQLEVVSAIGPPVAVEEEVRRAGDPGGAATRRPAAARPWSPPGRLLQVLAAMSPRSSLTSRPTPVVVVRGRPGRGR